jgi:hypothetical protein
MPRLVSTRPVRLLLAAAGLQAAGCADVGSPTAPGAAPAATLLVRASVTAVVSTLSAEVTAPDVPTPLVYNIPLAGGVAAGAITLPIGAARTLTLRAFDAAGTETHRGARTVDVAAGDNPPLAMTLLPLAGAQPIEATLGSVTVRVSPGTLALQPGGTARLAATVTGSDGTTLPGPVAWATLDPSVATVDAAGLVTARAVGDAQLVATYGAYGGAARITVAP